jgi:hypothetical protein
MADEVETTEEETTTDNIWAKLGITDPDETFEAEGEEAEAEAEKEDKTLRNVMPRVEALEKKMMEDHLQKAKDQYAKQADPIEAKIFAGVAGKVKTPEDLKHTIEVVHEQAEALKERIASVEAESRETVQKSWGVANPGQMAQPTDDEKKKLEEAIALGDTKAGFGAIMEDDPFLTGSI